MASGSGEGRGKGANVRRVARWRPVTGDPWLAGRGVYRGGPGCPILLGRRVSPGEINFVVVVAGGRARDAGDFISHIPSRTRRDPRLQRLNADVAASLTARHDDDDDDEHDRESQSSPLRSSSQLMHRCYRRVGHGKSATSLNFTSFAVSLRISSRERHIVGTKVVK